MRRRPGPGAAREGQTPVAEVRAIRFLAALAVGILIAWLIGQGVDAWEAPGGRFLDALPWLALTLVAAFAYAFGLAALMRRGG